MRRKAILLLGGLVVLLFFALVSPPRAHTPTTEPNNIHGYTYYWNESKQAWCKAPGARVTASKNGQACGGNAPSTAASVECYTGVPTLVSRGTSASTYEDVHGYVYYWNGTRWSRAVGAEVWVEKGGSLCAGPEWSDSRGYYTVNVCNCVRDGGTTLTVLGVYQGQWEGNATIYHPGPNHAVRVDLYLQRLEEGVPR